MLKALSVAAAALFATQALAGPAPATHLYPTFKPAHARGTVTTFQVTGAMIMDPVAINDSGVIAGTYWTSGSVFGGFVRTPDGTITTFEAPGAGVKSGNGTQVFGMNAAGDIVGTVTRNNVSHGYLRLANGTFVSFHPPGSAGTFLYGINNSDTVTGYYAKKSNNRGIGFVRASDGTITAFRYKNGTSPLAINDAGTTTGIFNADNGTDRGFVRTSTGDVKKFDFRSTPHLVQPAAINTAGTIAGYFTNSKNVFVGFLRAPGGTLTKFATPGAGTSEFQGTELAGLNDAGDVVGAYVSSDSRVHGYERSADGTVTAFDVDVTKGTHPTAINSAGTITGFSGKLGFVLN